MIKNCKRCDKEFITYLSRIKKGRGNFCSVSCSLFGEKRHSIPHTKEAKVKIGKNTPKYEGEKHWNWKGGIHKDKEHREKLHYIRSRRHLLKKRERKKKRKSKKHNMDLLALVVRKKSQK